MSCCVFLHNCAAEKQMHLPLFSKINVQPCLKISMLKIHHNMRWFYFAVTIAGYVQNLKSLKNCTGIIF